MARTRFDRDYYRIMECAPGVSEEEIRRAYRRLALRWHPDRNPGDPTAADRFKEISEAYAVLIDPAKRAEYDRLRGLGATGEFHHTQEELFRDLFANPRASAVFDELAREFARMGMQVDARRFEQTLFGGRAVVHGAVFVVTPLTLFRLARAAVRGARAATPVRQPASSSLPQSSGVLRALGRAGRWLLGVPAPAPGTDVTRGDAVVPLRLTAEEAARGVRKRVTLGGDGAEAVLVTVPPGVRAGTRLRLRGKGRPGPRGARGDAYLVVEVV